MLPPNNQVGAPLPCGPIYVDETHLPAIIF
uniref:Uncharacterized protein n=1 Tax=Nelumbo nucifera TaxID=4432 RepID=A0A822ZFN4_NELNU|nr:TPA_asm: hypothetical protein HUJ06_001613 [Nelumbo nucifera]